MLQAGDFMRGWKLEFSSDEHKKFKAASTQPMEKSIPGTYKVGGCRVKKPTGLLRDSSLRDH